MDRKHRLLYATILVIAVVIAYQPSLHNGFIWDDDLYVTKNLALRTFEGLKRIWTVRGATIQYYPVTFTSFWAEYQLFGLDPAVFHATNILLHAANAILVWFLLECLGLPWAWLAAILFAVHPVNVESVAWISERKNVLSGFFVLCSMLLLARLYLKESPQDSKERNGSKYRNAFIYIAALLFFILALLGKSVTCMMPLVFLILCWWKCGRLSLKNVTAMVPFLGAGIAAGINTLLFEKTLVGAHGPQWDLSLPERIIVAGRALWFYPYKLLLPAKLCFIYPKWQINPSDWHQYLFPAAAIAVLLVLWSVKNRTGRGPFTVASAFAVTIFPALGFINYYPMQFSFVADHFQYLAQIPLLAGAAWLGFHLTGNKGHKPPLVVMLVVPALLLSLCVKTRLEQEKYRDREALWSDTIAKNPGCWMAYNNLGCIFANTGETRKALPYFHKALSIKPDYFDAANNLFAYYRNTRQYDKAIALLHKLLRLRPDSAASIYYNLACIHSLKGDKSTALTYLQKAINRGFALWKLLRYDKDLENIRSTDYYKQLLKQLPKSAKAHKQTT